MVQVGIGARSFELSGADQALGAQVRLKGETDYRAARGG